MITTEPPLLVGLITMQHFGGIHLARSRMLLDIKNASGAIQVFFERMIFKELVIWNKVVHIVNLSV